MLKVYLAGGMSGISHEAANEWRKRFTTLRDATGVEMEIVNPMDYYNFQVKRHDTEKEVRDFDLWKLKRCDLVVANFNSPNSIGTAQEIAIAYENHIPVLGLNENRLELHPWLAECVAKMFVSMEDAMEYISLFYV